MWCCSSCPADLGETAINEGREGEQSRAEHCWLRGLETHPEFTSRGTPSLCQVLSWVKTARGPSPAWHPGGTGTDVLAEASASAGGWTSRRALLCGQQGHVQGPLSRDVGRRSRGQKAFSSALASFSRLCVRPHSLLNHRPCCLP